MASANQNPVFKDGGSNNKPPLFYGEYFDFWKIRMKAHLEAQGEEVWEAVLQDPHVPVTVVNGVGSNKPKASWDDNDRNDNTILYHIFSLKSIDIYSIFRLLC